MPGYFDDIEIGQVVSLGAAVLDPDAMDGLHRTPSRPAGI